MRFASVTDRLARLGSDKWAVHVEGQRRKAAGQDIVLASIGEPDRAASPVLVAAAIAGLQAGRTGYSSGQGEPGLRQAIARAYSTRRGRAIAADQVMCVPGTQTALCLAMATLLDPGDQVLVGDPCYVTYEGVIAAPGGQLVPVPLRAEAGFRLDPADIEAAITPRSRVILLNSPHNPSGAILDRDCLARIGEIARRHDLWIVSDEVYEELTFGPGFVSPLDLPELAERTVVLSSVSKSHAAPGFRSGWLIGPETFVQRALPLSETLLFGNQPFLADATAAVLDQPNPTGVALRDSYAARARRLVDGVAQVPGLVAAMPDAGMFVMVDVRGTGLDGTGFAWKLLDRHGVAVMPGAAFGAQGAGFVRVSLTVPDAALDRVIAALADCAQAVAA